MTRVKLLAMVATVAGGLGLASAVEAAPLTPAPAEALVGGATTTKAYYGYGYRRPFFRPYGYYRPRPYFGYRRFYGPRFYGPRPFYGPGRFYGPRRFY